MKLRKYTLDELKRAIEGSVSIRQTLQKLNVKAEGGNYQVFHKAVRHFRLCHALTPTYRGKNRGRQIAPKA